MKASSLRELDLNTKKARWLLTGLAYFCCCRFGGLFSYEWSCGLWCTQLWFQSHTYGCWNHCWWTTRRSSPGETWHQWICHRWCSPWFLPLSSSSGPWLYSSNIRWEQGSSSMSSYSMLKFSLKCALAGKADAQSNWHLNIQWWWNNATITKIHFEWYMNLSETSQYTYILKAVS